MCVLVLSNCIPKGLVAPVNSNVCNNFTLRVLQCVRVRIAVLVNLRGFDLDLFHLRPCQEASTITPLIRRLTVCTGRVERHSVRLTLFSQERNEGLCEGLLISTTVVRVLRYSTRIYVNEGFVEVVSV